MGCARYVGAAIVVAGALVAVQPAPAAPAGTAVIAGQIFSEWSKWDAPDRNAKGIAGLTVEVVATTWPSSEFPPFAEKPAEPLATTTTSADGTFRIEKLPAGRLGLIVRGPKIAPTLIDGFRVTEGGVYRGHEFVCERTPRVFTSKIVRKDGGPVGGLEIFAWKTSIHTPLVFGHREVVRTKTGPDGSFTLSGTIDYPDVVVPTGPSSYRYLEVRRNWRDPTPETLTLGGDATLDVVVTDAGGKPVPGARVRLICDGLLEERTSAEGRCSFSGLAPGGFVLVADASGLAGTPVAGAAASLFGDKPDPKFAPLVSGRNERKVVLAKACTLTGTVADRAGGAPVAGARVRFVTALSPMLSAPETTTDSAGRFTLRDLPPGGGVVVVDKEWWRQTELYSGQPWEFVRNAARGETRAGAAVQGPTVSFAAPGTSLDGSFPLDRYAPTTFEVKDSSGKPVVGASLAFLDPKEEDGGLPFQHRDAFAAYLPMTRVVYADDRGRATADVQPAGGELWVTAPGFPQWTERIEPLKERAAGTRVVVVQRDAIADLRVVDSVGKPVAGAWVWKEGLRRPGKKPDDMPDADRATFARMGKPEVADAAGKVRCRAWPGPIFVVAGRPGLLGTAVVRVDAPEGGPTTLDVKIAPVAAIEGRVAHGGKPREGARVRVIERLPPAPKDAYPKEPQFADIAVRADGTFRVDSMLTGRVALFAYVPTKDDPDYAELMSDVAEIDVKSGAATVLSAPLDLHEPK